MLEHRLMGQLFRIGLAQPLLSAPHGGGVGKECYDFYVMTHCVLCYLCADF